MAFMSAGIIINLVLGFRPPGTLASSHRSNWPAYIGILSTSFDLSSSLSYKRRLHEQYQTRQTLLIWYWLMALVILSMRQLRLAQGQALMLILPSRDQGAWSRATTCI
jgi:hypothetical protein